MPTMHLLKKNSVPRETKPPRRPRRKHQRAIHNLVFIVNFTIITGAIAGSVMSIGTAQVTPASTPSPYTLLPVTQKIEPRGATPKTTTAVFSPSALPKPHPLLNPLSTPPAVSKTTPKMPVQAPVAKQPGIPKPPVKWTTEEIARAKSACATILKSHAVTFKQIVPIRKGACGDPAPIRVSRIGTSPGIELNPPATMNCRFTARVAKWLTETVQPAARKTLKSDVTRLRTMASYSCRNRYGRPGARLSEHALANALDIGSFKLANGQEISVLSDWGPIKRKLRAAQQKSNDAGNQAGIDPRLSSKAKWITKVATASPSAPPRSSKAILTTNQPNPPAAATSLKPAAKFLRSVHKTACSHFGTVLGPEANTAHENHFHLDLAPRRNSAFCE